MYNFLHEQRIGVMSTTDADGTPLGTVIYFTVNSNLSLRILTKKRTRKYQNLKRDSRVMLTVFDSRSQTTLQYLGTAVEQEGQRASYEVANAMFDITLSTSDSGLPPIAKLQAGAFTTFRIEPVQLRMASFGQAKTGDYNELFESIDSFELTDD